MNTSLTTARSCGALALAAALLLVAGCSDKSVVAGKVTFNGAPIKGGIVTFIGAHNERQVANINGDGVYVMEDPPGGAVKVTVTGPRVNIRMPATAPPVVKNPHLLPPLPAASQPLPWRYARPDNGLTFVVTKGRQTYNIDLTP
jgi:hypothetical protein